VSSKKCRTARWAARIGYDRLGEQRQEIIKE
jgi:hypothetical protein